ncbi:MAG: hypothetical protein KAT16_08905 [Candidatus Heimdallarchaeota archaeon]|nr:hypothetical protein [Candidatus Heimdallarchaeota archaeon]
MASVTNFQKMELILIPAIFLFSQVLILLFGLSIIGEETWIVMGIPMMLGGILSVIILILILKYVKIEEFRQLEVFFRVLTILGGIAIILILAIQIFLHETGYVIFSLQTLIISIIGYAMTIMCISFLKKTFPIQGLSE